VYPDFDVDFIMETDASVEGLGAILSQKKSMPASLLQQMNDTTVLLN